MKKSIQVLLLAVCLICCLIVEKAHAQEESSSPKIVIAYFSHSGNTQNIALQIQNVVGGDLFRIEPAKAYPKDYQEILKVSKKEIHEGYKPVLKEKVKNIEQYDIIFIGSPNWYSTIAPPVASFLSEYDLSGKKVIPFITHGGGGKANCFTDIENMCPKATVTKGLAISGRALDTAHQKIVEWLKEINLLAE